MGKGQPQRSLEKCLGRVHSESFALKKRKERKRPFIISSVNHGAGGLSQAVGQESGEEIPGLDETR